MGQSEPFRVRLPGEIKKLLAARAKAAKVTEAEIARRAISAAMIAPCKRCHGTGRES